MFEDAGTVVEKAIGKARGRKDAGGQEEVLKLDALKGGVIGELVMLKLSAKWAAQDLSFAVKEKAQAAGINAAALRSYVNALAAKELDKPRRNAEQLSLLFDSGIVA